MTHPVLTDFTPVLVVGVTGAGARYGGKSATANWWQDMAVEEGHFEYSICFDPKGNNFKGTVVRDAETASRAVADGDRRLDWCPRSVDNIEEKHRAAVRFADGLQGSVILVHDDAAMYADSDGLARATSMMGNPSGNSGGVKSLVVAQDPFDLPRKSVRTNLPVMVWVGPVTEDSKKYFDVMQRQSAGESVQQMHTEPHMWTIIDGDETTTFEPVSSTYA